MSGLCFGSTTLVLIARDNQDTLFVLITGAHISGTAVVERFVGLSRLLIATCAVATSKFMQNLSYIECLEPRAGEQCRIHEEGAM